MKLSNIIYFQGHLPLYHKKAAKSFHNNIIILQTATHLKISKHKPMTVHNVKKLSILAAPLRFVAHSALSLQ